MDKKLITSFEEGSFLEYAPGRFDNWCIYHVGSHFRYAIKDIDIFNLLNNCASPLSRERIYEDFVEFYNKTTKSIDSTVLNEIKLIAKSYQSYTNKIVFIFSFLYAGMVAEENKKNAILKKRIKRLAMHQLLIENLSPQVTANFSRGHKWYWLDKECKKRGF